MITRIREVRQARGLTLEDVARSCVPPTTPQTIGRLETGTRTVSIGWLNRIAGALGVDAAELVARDDNAEDVKVAAIVGPGGATAPRKSLVVIPPRPGAGAMAVVVRSAIGDYRAGDELWCEPLEPENFARALNRDVLIPRRPGRFLFGRLIDRDSERLQVLPLSGGARQQVVANPPWIAMVVKLVRGL